MRLGLVVSEVFDYGQCFADRLYPVGKSYSMECKSCLPVLARIRGAVGNGIYQQLVRACAEHKLQVQKRIGTRQLAGPAETDRLKIFL